MRMELKRLQKELGIDVYKRQDIGSMDYDQAVKKGEICFGWSMWMEQDLSLIHI